MFLKFWEVLVRYFYRLPLNWNCSDVFLLINLGLCVFRRKTTELTISSYIKSKYSQDDLSLLVLSLTKIVFFWYLHCKVTSLPCNTLMPFYIVLGKKVTMPRPNLRSGELCSSILRAENSDKICGILLLYLKFVYSASFIHSLTHSFIMVHQYGFMYIYFTLWAIIQCNFIHLVAQIFQLWHWELFQLAFASL